jgi:hypothetical protein
MKGKAKPYMQLTNTRTITSQTKLLTIVCNLALESSLPINTRTTPTTMLRVIVTGITQGLSATPKTHLDIRGNSPPHSAKGSLNPRPSMETKEAHIIPMHKINIDGAKTAILRIIIIIAERRSPLAADSNYKSALKQRNTFKLQKTTANSSAVSG